MFTEAEEVTARNSKRFWNNIDDNYSGCHMEALISLQNRMPNEGDLLGMKFRKK
jgi:hypothetical protein